ncbi:YfbK domain-containing protein [Novosphingobium mangrovi (ex Huang et al. 2023)]|uniref:von Willebrand factor type A domain-containing protein n=1 Tax=Novosphingobium mangrovi (ex Huang et al. 2023) TaxID=2976432 RepID=A0ABT2I010_9SPHN|nr:von Willebrand factor type A domain-containing protein [Novosphingobium mangrovi (ex Huang et al. 2023)]MCT2398130.1 von Willebrand factor type A domain-containing protein [Novosphingobium mangrovi (ex Huang et al. 2023)]
MWITRSKACAAVMAMTSTAAFGILAGCSAANQAPPERVTTVDIKEPRGNVAPPPPPPPAQATTSAEQSVIITTGRKATAADVGASMVPAPAYAPPLQAYAPPLQAYVPPVQMAVDPGRERYAGKEVSPVHLVQSEPVSTFSVDVDTGAYANVRRFLTQGRLPPQSAVRTEEMINYFRYAYPRPDSREAPFSVTTDVATTPWNPHTRLLRVGLRGYDLPRNARPPANLVFLLDVSGSMNSPDKLPLLKTALSGLAGELGPKDQVSIVVYAGAAGLVLQPTNDPRKIRAALDRLQAGGSTAGAAGLKLAYNIARDNFIEGGVNRVLIGTDGDFNVGVSNNDDLIAMIEKERDSGITLTTLGFGQGNYNEAMMEQIADHGNGNYSYIDTALEAKKVLGDEMSSTLFTIAKDVKIQVEFNPAVVSQYRLLGYENRALREEDFDNDRVDAGDIGAGHQVTAIYEIVPAGAKGWIAPRRYDRDAPMAGNPAKELAYVKLRYKLPGGDTSKLIERPVPASLMANARPATGDFAFASAVAAFGQTLRGDELMNGYSGEQIASLAGTQSDYWRQEFLKLVDMADTLKGG